MGAAARPLSERVVLVVDDENLVRHLTACILADAGFRVLEAHCGEEAVALLSTLDGMVDLVVSDISMPGISGEVLAAAIAERWPRPVLLMSGQGGPAAEYTGVFLPKPFTADGLLDAVGVLVPLRRDAAEPFRASGAAPGKSAVIT
jgi:DNA-binding NtrC family response regulator